MPKLTLKQEKFCLAYLETGNASEAYRRAFKTERMKSETINRNAKFMTDDNKIITRLEELRVPIIERHKITVDDLLRELDENRKAALTAETVQSSAATAATMAKAKLLGYDKQIVEMYGANGSPFVAEIRLVKPEDKLQIEDNAD